MALDLFGAAAGNCWPVYDARHGRRVEICKSDPAVLPLAPNTMIGVDAIFAGELRC